MNQDKLQKIGKAFAVFSLFLIAPFCASTVLAVFISISALQFIDSGMTAMQNFLYYAGLVLFVYIIPIIFLITAGISTRKIIGSNSWQYCLLFSGFWATFTLSLFPFLSWHINGFFISEIALLLSIPALANKFLNKKVIIYGKSPKQYFRYLLFGKKLSESPDSLQKETSNP